MHKTVIWPLGAKWSFDRFPNGQKNFKFFWLNRPVPVPVPVRFRFGSGSVRFSQKILKFFLVRFRFRFRFRFWIPRTEPEPDFDRFRFRFRFKTGNSGSGSGFLTTVPVRTGGPNRTVVRSSPSTVRAVEPYWRKENKGYLPRPVVPKENDESSR